MTRVTMKIDANTLWRKLGVYAQMSRIAHYNMERTIYADVVEMTNYEITVKYHGKRFKIEYDMLVGNIITFIAEKDSGEVIKVRTTFYGHEYQRGLGDKLQALCDMIDIAYERYTDYGWETIKRTFIPSRYDTEEEFSEYMKILFDFRK